MRREDPDFIGEVENSMFSFEEFLGINDLIVGEVIEALKTEARTWALALYRSDQALVDKFMKNMRPPELYAYREALDGLKQVLAREQTAARFRIVAKARELESSSKFILKRYSTVYDSST